MQYHIGVNLNRFPKKITLSYGEDETREWYEYWEKRRGKARRGIVVQKIKGGPFYIFFILGQRAWTLEEFKNMPFAVNTIEEAKQILEKLGFEAEIQN